MSRSIFSIRSWRSSFMRWLSPQLVYHADLHVDDINADVGSVHIRYRGNPFASPPLSPITPPGFSAGARRRRHLSTASRLAKATDLVPSLHLGGYLGDGAKRTRRRRGSPPGPRSSSSIRRARASLGFILSCRLGVALRRDLPGYGLENAAPHIEPFYHGIWTKRHYGRTAP